REVARVHDDVSRASLLTYDSAPLDADMSSALVCRAPGPSDVVGDRETYDHMHDAVAALPERLRRVVVGYFFENRPMQEIADALGVTESRVSQMRSEAMVLMREAMEAHLEPERGGPVPAANLRVARRKAAYHADVAAAARFRASRACATTLLPA
ncbi:MAG: sigma-70 family RNA polymerase sigma factor, partial [Acidimicrobiales bacterium]